MRRRSIPLPWPGTCSQEGSERLSATASCSCWSCCARCAWAAAVSCCRLLSIATCGADPGILLFGRGQRGQHEGLRGSVLLLLRWCLGVGRQPIPPALVQPHQQLTSIAQLDSIAAILAQVATLPCNRSSSPQTTS